MMSDDRKDPKDARESCAPAMPPEALEVAGESLGWDDERGALMTHEMPSGVTLGLRIADLSLLKVSEQGAALFPLDRLGDADANAWVREAIGASGVKVIRRPSTVRVPDLGAPSTRTSNEASSTVAGSTSRTHRTSTEPIGPAAGPGPG